MLSKNVNNRKCAPKLILFNWKKMRKIPMIFDIEINFESQILAFFDTSPLHLFSKFNNILWVCWFLGKNISNFVHPAWKLVNLYCHGEGQFPPYPPTPHLQLPPALFLSGMTFYLSWISDSRVWRQTCKYVFYEYCSLQEQYTGDPRILWFHNSWSPLFHDSVSGFISWCWRKKSKKILFFRKHFLDFFIKILIYSFFY